MKKLIGFRHIDTLTQGVMLWMVCGVFVLVSTTMAQASQPASVPTSDGARQSAVIADRNPSQTVSLPPAPLEENGQQAQEDCLPLPFGQSLFSDGTRPSPNAILSSKQRVTQGDRISLAVWGAVQVEEIVSVDSQGFIYVRNVGPINVLGKSEDVLGQHIQHEINRIYRDVQVYARLEQSAGTPVMVTGNVGRPGQYYGSAEDDVVVWLQRAGGVLPEQGSYRSVRILRDKQQIAEIDLYDFLRNGKIEKMAWRAHDVIVVGTPRAQIAAIGDTRRCALFEIKESDGNGKTLIDLAQPLPRTTHAIVSGYRDNKPFSQVYSLAALSQAHLLDSDVVRFYSSPQSEKITVHIDGPTLGNRILVVPIHSRLSDVLKHVPVDEAISDTQAISLKRKSVALAQTEALNQSLNRLLQSVMTAPAQSDGEAAIRANEVQMIERFVANARNVRPDGRVVVFQNGRLNDLSLEDGDVVVIPQKTDVISVEGEVVLPRTVVAGDKKTVSDYVMMSGGYTERALKKDYIVIHPNGDATRSSSPDIRPGDRLLVLPRVDSKTMQTTKDLVQILYQVAVGAGVLLSIDK